MTLVAFPVRTLVFVGLLVSVLAWAGCAGTLEDPARHDRERLGCGGQRRGVGSELASMSRPRSPRAAERRAVTIPRPRPKGSTSGPPALRSRLVGVPTVEGVGLLIDPSTPVEERRLHEADRDAPVRRPHADRQLPQRRDDPVRARLGHDRGASASSSPMAAHLRASMPARRSTRARATPAASHPLRLSAWRPGRRAP